VKSISCTLTPHPTDLSRLNCQTYSLYSRFWVTGEIIASKKEQMMVRSLITLVPKITAAREIREMETNNHPILLVFLSVFSAVETVV